MYYSKKDEVATMPPRDFAQKPQRNHSAKPTNMQLDDFSTEFPDAEPIVEAADLAPAEAAAADQSYDESTVAGDS